MLVLPSVANCGALVNHHHQWVLLLLLPSPFLTYFRGSNRAFFPNVFLHVSLLLWWKMAPHHGDIIQKASSSLHAIDIPLFLAQTAISNLQSRYSSFPTPLSFCAMSTIWMQSLKWAQTMFCLYAKSELALTMIYLRPSSNTDFLQQAFQSNCKFCAPQCKSFWFCCSCTAFKHRFLFIQFIANRWIRTSFPGR